MTPKEIALTLVVSSHKNLKLSDDVEVCCSICKSIYVKKFQYVIKCCRNSGTYKCRSCSNKQTLSNPVTQAKIKSVRSVSKCSETMKKRWQDKQYRDKMLLCFKKSAKNDTDRAGRTKKYWENQQYRDNISGKSKSNYNFQFTDEIRSKLSAATKRNWLDEDISKKYKDGLRKAHSKALVTKVSSLNIIIHNILNSLHIDHEMEFAFGPYSFDFRIGNILLEIQGWYWHQLPQNALRDRQKASFIANHPQYKLHYILEHEFAQPLSISSKLKSILNIEDVCSDFNLKECTIEKIQFEEASLFISSWHYLHNISKNSTIYGLKLHDKLIAVCSFSPPIRSETASKQKVDNNEILELSRFCIMPGYHKKNLGSYFISRCIYMLPNHIKVLVSFADTTYGHDGTIYKASNWKFDGVVKPSYWYINQNNWIIHKKTVYNRAVKMGLTEREYANQHQLIRQSGKKIHRYIYLRN